MKALTEEQLADLAAGVARLRQRRMTGLLANHIVEIDVYASAYSAALRDGTTPTIGATLAMWWVIESDRIEDLWLDDVISQDARRARLRRLRALVFSAEATTVYEARFGSSRR